MQGLKVVEHSARMMLRNWQQILQIGLAPVAIAILAFSVGLGPYLGAMGTDGVPQLTDPEIAADAPPDVGFAFSLFVAMCFSMIMMIWGTVNWHRFVLLEMYPKGWWPPFPFGLVLGYLGRVFMIILIMVLAMVPVLLVGIFLAQTGAHGFVDLLMPVIGILISYLFLRLCLILPAGAIDRHMTLTESWSATAKDKSMILSITIALVVIGFVAQLLAFIPLIGALIGFAASVFIGLLNISVVTTLYGIVIEHRTID